MSVALTPIRRAIVAAFALAAAATLFRAQLADALVVRGDDLLYRGAGAEARTHYARALVLDPQSAVAADRYVFATMELHTPRALGEALSAASAYLRRHPDEVNVLADRAMCYLLARRYAAAGRDFERAGEISAQPRYFVFAGWAARRAREYRSARRLWRAALRIDSRYAPALTALAEVHS